MMLFLSCCCQYVDDTGIRCCTLLAIGTENSARVRLGYAFRVWQCKTPSWDVRAMWYGSVRPDDAIYMSKMLLNAPRYHFNVSLAD